MGVIDAVFAGALIALAILALALIVGRQRTTLGRYRLLWENLPASAVGLVDRKLRVKLLAGQGLRPAGWTAEEVEGKALDELVPDSLMPHFRAALRGETRSFEYRSARSGREYWVQFAPVTTRRGSVSGGIAIWLDITDRSWVEHALGGDAAEVDAVAEATRALARSTDPLSARVAVCEGARQVAEAPIAALFEPGPSGSGELVAKAAAGADLTGMTLSLQGDSGAARAFARAEDSFVARTEQAADADREFLRRARARSVLWHPVVRDRAAIGVLAIAWHEETEAVPLRLTALVDLLGAEAAVAIGRADLLGHLEHMARTDDLTGLPNRRYWEEQLPKELARAWREERPVCVAMLDLDHFKDYNDRRGHQAGDRLLREAAARWRSALRPYDIVARYGGEEFALILPGCAMPEAYALVERLRGQTPERESCSAGIAEWDSHEAAEALVGRADAALYRAKRAGRDRAIAASG
jgi:diguanylate cyclase (GGDEF)-like protein/PAS domain S-box-containing protein